ncbi:hypothetical protein E4U09_003662 [Claviceps aff. purpurea]|uniref:Uncharacterized protein n=1 Tax=Claviceps aff. purpurea TaxID=1967640 RepID=A0A9P7QEA1_9HYPO|nr:hypothetical protein E4U09_003662 [Claviceps aff. purpurea]
MSPHDPPPSSDSGLSPAQITALFDILTHHETYREITAFRFPDAVTRFGYPFEEDAAASAAGAGAGVSAKTAGLGPCGLDGGGARDFDIDREDHKKNRQKRSQSQKNQKDQKYQKNQSREPSAPLLQSLLTRLLLPMPGLSDLPAAFWTSRLQTLLARLGQANLSESYDKGALGTRKVLATGCSALLEMLSRGLLGGLPRGEGTSRDEGSGTGTGTGTEAGVKADENEKQYDLNKADDLERAWGNVLQELVYGDLVDQLFDHFGTEDDLETLSPMAEASARHNILHIATLIHQIFVLSPEGLYLLKLLDNVHSLIPYKLIRQTLRIGNAATMISGMMRILLAKLSLTSVTNWFGLTQNPDDGMNLVQRIISLVLSWDANDFRKGADKIEKAKGGDAPTDEMLRLIREYLEQPRSHHDDIRSASQRNEQSIMTEIFNALSPHINARLTDAQHAQCLEYYSSLLSVRDRDCITAVFCRQAPDMLTQALKDIVTAYNPIIRAVHANIDLRDHFDAMQAFLEDFLKTGRRGPATADNGSGVAKEQEGSQADQDGKKRDSSVEDYFALLMRHRGSLYKWVHALASQCPDVWESFRVWAKNTLVQFQARDINSGAGSDGNGHGHGHHGAAASHSILDTLNNLYTALDPDTQTKVRTAIDSHAAYLSTQTLVSQARLQYLVTASQSDSSGGSTVGPGVYLSRWQSLLDETPITPSQRKGPVRSGRDVKYRTTMGKMGAGGNTVDAGEAAHGEVVEAPDVSVVVGTLGEAFRRAVES